jgi:hypothetical protein
LPASEGMSCSGLKGRDLPKNMVMVRRLIRWCSVLRECWRGGYIPRQELGGFGPKGAFELSS